METKEIVGKIKSICKSQNLKISALLKNAELSPNVIDDWQSDKTEPSFPALFQICKVLNIEIEELFTDSKLHLTLSQENILNEWKMLSVQEKQAVMDYIAALKSNHR